MSTYNCLIVDSIHADALHLHILLSNLPLVITTKQCFTQGEAIALLATQKYDLIFIDTHLPDTPGISWLHHVVDGTPVVITSHLPDFAVESYELNVLDYLLKPISTVRFLRTVIRALVNGQSERTRIPQSIFLHTGQRSHLIPYDDILYIEATGAHSTVYRNDSILVVRDSISWFASQLPNSDFLRVQRSFIINLKKISLLDAKSVWIGKTKISVGLQYREFVHQFVVGSTP